MLRLLVCDTCIVWCGEFDFCLGTEVPRLSAGVLGPASKRNTATRTFSYASAMMSMHAHVQLAGVGNNSTIVVSEAPDILAKDKIRKTRAEARV